MKYFKIFSGVLLIVSTLIFAGFQVMQYMTEDEIAPVISFESDTIQVSVKDTRDALLQGVTAQDDQDGDVSEDILVENVSTVMENGRCTVTYAAIDSQMNVSRKERTAIYTDYEVPKFSLSEPLCFSIGSARTSDLLEHIGAWSVIDGDLQNRIKYSLGRTLDMSKVGDYPIEFRVLDSAGNQVYLNTTISIHDREYNTLTVTLTDYLIYLEKGADFDAMKYLESVTWATGVSEDETIVLAEGEMQLESDVDTSAEGTYTVDYYVDHEGRLGRSRLVVVVE